MVVETVRGLGAATHLEKPNSPTAQHAKRFEGRECGGTRRKYIYLNYGGHECAATLHRLWKKHLQVDWSTSVSRPHMIPYRELCLHVLIDASALRSWLNNLGIGWRASAQECDCIMRCL